MAAVPIAKYTTTDAVRGALGVTDNELEDAMLQNQQLDMALLSDLAAWLPNHAALYAAGQAVASAEADKMIAWNIQLYSQWFCATRAAEMQLAMPQTISDGKTEIRRFQNLDLDKIAERAAARAKHYKDQLASVAVAAAEVAVPKLFGSATPDYDPVAGA